MKKRFDGQGAYKLKVNTPNGEMDADVYYTHGYNPIFCIHMSDYNLTYHEYPVFIILTFGLKFTENNREIIGFDVAHLTVWGRNPDAKAKDMHDRYRFIPDVAKRFETEMTEWFEDYISDNTVRALLEKVLSDQRKSIRQEHEQFIDAAAKALNNIEVDFANTEKNDQLDTVLADRIYSLDSLINQESKYYE
jgi:hypothetical protein